MGEFSGIRALTVKQPWAWAIGGEDLYPHADGRRITEVWHYVLSGVVPLDDPIPCRGQLGMWKPPTEVVRRVLDQLGQAVADA